MSTIKDMNLAPSGERKIRWVEAHMPVLRDIGSDFAREKPFAGLKIALSVHLEAKTAYLCRVLEMGGAEMHVTGSNPLSTQNDVAAALAAKGMDVHAVYGCTDEAYQTHLRRVLSVGVLAAVMIEEYFFSFGSSGNSMLSSTELTTLITALQ